MTRPNIRKPAPVGPHVQWLRDGEYQVRGLQEQSPTFATRAAAELWLRARLPKVPEARRPRERRCMCCSEPFLSEGFHNRLCKTCRLRNDGGSLTIAANATGKVRRAARA